MKELKEWLLKQIQTATKQREHACRQHFATFAAFSNGVKQTFEVVLEHINKSEQG